MKEGEQRIVKIHTAEEVDIVMQSELEHFETLVNEGQFTAEDLRQFNKKHDFK